MHLHGRTVFIDPSLSSAANQSFTVGAGATAISPITIQVPANVTSGAVGSSGNDIRVSIPLGFNMEWDITDVTASLSGSAAGKCSSTVSYEDGNQTLVLNLLSDMTGGETLTVDGLSFTNFSATSTVD